MLTATRAASIAWLAACEAGALHVASGRASQARRPQASKYALSGKPSTHAAVSLQARRAAPGASRPQRLIQPPHPPITIIMHPKPGLQPRRTPSPNGAERRVRRG
eukprot:scaffold3735_cov367-Prasinococcus_capsulatus_cf.AAC.7